jgi:uncharacterized membrane protein AbrB (regulator of aidB expression)
MINNSTFIYNFFFFFFFVFVVTLLNRQILFIIIRSFPKADMRTDKEGTLPGKFTGVPNIGLANGAEWKAHRMVANPSLHGSSCLEN